VPSEPDPNYQVVETIPFGKPSRRVKPPSHLPAAAKRTFANLTASHAVGHFRAGDLDLLSAWAEAAAMREEAARHLLKDGMLTEDGKESPWFRLHASASKTLATLAGRLKIGPSSRMTRQSRREPSPMSAYDQFALKEGWDDDDEHSGRG
jgi:phage terminase small subunit